MAKKCELCGKKPLVGNNVSHSNLKTKKRTLPNLQVVRTVQNSNTVTLKVCTSCLKKGKVIKAYKKRDQNYKLKTEAENLLKSFVSA